MHGLRLSSAVLISALTPTSGFEVPSASLSRSSVLSTPTTTSSFVCPFGSAAASSVKTASHESSTETKLADPSEGPILEPQGNHHPWYSMAPFTEVGEFGSGEGMYFNKLKEANGGATVFKMHPGLKMIAITDHASAKWFFAQTEGVLDRQDGAYFGQARCAKEYVGESLPALIANMKESHSEARSFMLDVLRERVGATETALRHSTDNFYKHLKENGLGDHPTVYDTFLRGTYAMVLEWALGTGEEGGQPLPPFEDFVNVNPSDLNLLIELEIDTPIANAAVQILQRIKSPVTKDQKASIQVLLDSITSSKSWPRFMEVLENNKVPITQPERSFMFTTGFQSSAAMAKNMEFAIGGLNANPDFLKELQHELDGQDLTGEAVMDEARFPLLDSFHWELLRMFPAPRLYVKEAQMDLVVPTSNGDRYQIRKGDNVMCHQALAQMDELKFGPDAKVFNPRRFVGNPELKKDIFAFGYTDSFDPSPKKGMPWGCVAHALGFVEKMMKVIYGRWVQEYTWEMTEPTVVDPDLFLAFVGPKGMSFSKITPRK